MSPSSLLLSSDPLCDEACQFLVRYKEESDLIDFKELFDPTSNSKSWIDLAIDCAAFANTFGGYLVFGVRDKTWDLVGLESEVALALSDTKKVLEKINRGLVPPITRARTRLYQEDATRFVVLAVPQSKECTHVFESDVSWRNPKGETIAGVRRGTIYTRRSGSNAIVTSADFEQVIERRLHHFRDKVLDGIARVVNSTPDTHVVTVTKVVGARGEAGIQVVDAAPTSDLVGRSLSFTAATLADKINLYSALVGPEDSKRVDVRMLFEAFAVRHAEQFYPYHREWLALYSLLLHAPVFFWLRDVRPAEARELIESAYKAASDLQRAFILNYAGFYGESFHKKLHERAPPASARPLQPKPYIFNTSRSRHQKVDEARATELGQQLAKSHDERAVYELERLDCALYAPFD